MRNHHDIILKQLYDAFSFVEKPDPLTTYEGSYWDPQVDIFNNLDWENATYTDFASGMEGVIICPALTKVYLLPRLFKMMIMQRSGLHEGAADNLAAEQLKSWPTDTNVERLFSRGQKDAIIDTWNFIEFCIYDNADIPMAQELSVRWSLPR